MLTAVPLSSLYKSKQTIFTLLHDIVKQDTALQVAMKYLGCTSTV